MIISALQHHIRSSLWFFSLELLRNYFHVSGLSLIERRNVLLLFLLLSLALTKQISVCPPANIPSILLILGGYFDYEFFREWITLFIFIFFPADNGVFCLAWIGLVVALALALALALSSGY